MNTLSENQGQFHEGNTMNAFEIPKKTQQDLLDEKEFKDFETYCELNQNGVPGKLLTGHGPELEHFERVDLATTKNLSYEQKQTAP